MDTDIGHRPIWMKGGTRFELPTLLFEEGWKDETPSDLTALKNQILPYEEQGHWELLKKMVNPYELVYTPEDRQFHPSIAIVKPLSRSYFKMVELLDASQWLASLPKQNPKVRTAHVAEGPGGFIQAVVDCLERGQKIFQSATAITLKPTDHRVPGWRRASSFLQKHKQVKLVYGADGTGDIYKPENQAAFIEASRPGVQLFTADGGFDFSMNYQIQEKQIYPLLLASAYTGIRCLSTGGFLIMKIFDSYAAPTKILLSLLGRAFTTWSLIKPRLSRPCNSERYFVGRDFKGILPNFHKAFESLIAEAAVGRYPANAEGVLSPEEAKTLDTLSAWSTQSQTEALQKALCIAEDPAKWYAEDLESSFQTSLLWCQTYRIPTTLKQPTAVVNPVLTAMKIHRCSAAEASGPPPPTPGAESCHRDPSDPA